ncbi:flagellar protein [Ornithinibacillus californiensis]|uniref:flagellar protein n=1 Tax=Ornithinibacillus californiensis TaxID=161536 RepID=UPI00064D7475|nr:flagellar protein [Ornithinibacillus californiensis]
MNRVKPIYDITQKMKQLLDADFSSNDRQNVIQEVNSLLLQRGVYMEEAKEPYSTEELEMGKELLPLNTEVQQKLDSLFQGLKNEMKQVKKQKNSNRKYTNPYDKVQTIDGMFMDKRK